LLSLGREVEKSGSYEIESFEDLEVALGGVVAFGEIDDALAGGVPGGLLEKELVPQLN
jgi:hypothetical protein